MWRQQWISPLCFSFPHIISMGFFLQTLRQEVLQKQAQDAKQAGEDGGADKENQQASKNLGIPQYSEKEEEEYKKLEQELRIHLGLNDTQDGK